ncbi:hypothetical protein QBC40DRAFT_169925 [Triangularia verruculosa]|uniref:Uncharacterized protein n=1 Tax=Triangularia verruculosa TaxID=2587418 RepID=A0AAN7AUY9_9PEZI|nr:hypothetical protein QBC40DRAFT_169925 [Triangularia verruculosa]
MSTNKPEVTTTKFDRVRHKLDRYCVQRDKLLAQVTVSQNELMIICQKRNGYSSLGPVFRQRLHVFLQGEREQAEIWRDAVTRQFPGWFDLPHNKEDVRDGLKEDWEAFRKLGWFEAQSTPDNLSALRKRQRESRILPDTQLEKLVAVNILVESLVKEQLKAQEDSSQNFGYVDAAVQTDGSSRPPILMTSNAASGNSPSRATGSRRKRSRVTREPSVTPSLRDAFVSLLSGFTPDQVLMSWF